MQAEAYYFLFLRDSTTAAAIRPRTPIAAITDFFIMSSPLHVRICQQKVVALNFDASNFEHQRHGASKIHNRVVSTFAIDSRFNSVEVLLLTNSW